MYYNRIVLVVFFAAISSLRSKNTISDDDDSSDLFDLFLEFFRISMYTQQWITLFRLSGGERVHIWEKKEQNFSVQKLIFK